MTLMQQLPKQVWDVSLILRLSWQLFNEVDAAYVARKRAHYRPVVESEYHARMAKLQNPHKK